MGMALQDMEEAIREGAAGLGVDDLFTDQL